MVHLEDVATEITVGHVGSMANEYIEDGVPFLRSLNVLPHRIETSEIKYISPGFHGKLKKSALKPGDVVIVRTGKPGTCAVIPGDLPVSNCSDLVIVRCGPELRPRFLAYWVNTIARDHVASHVVGAVQQHFNVGSAKKMPIRLPDLRVQDDILSILGALDDKIELNRKTAATLEEMARALYRSWFVDFDPVHAKAAGRAPAHMDAQTAALFPDNFGEDGLPEGWVSETVGDLFTLQRGFDLPKKNREDGPYPVLAAGGHHGTHKDFKVKGPGVTTGRSGVIGEVFLVLEDFWPLNTSLWVKEFKKCSPFFAYFFLQTLDLKALNSGSAVPSLNRNNVHNLAVGTPPSDVISSFDNLVSPMFNRIQAATNESQTLATLRDTLLPRLMSGELRVGEAKEQVGEFV
ncbi:restriction endonuclease subunit S [Leisingera sp. ANG-M7]|uniref:restriction endonuclease subunit S n=1 Tax=Leisingera sp. ANG-M7 TaxID=1577902 RepID=UPI00187CAD34|nr:restriction endonuclease subunit S [Leisingera sp. ANG-M7]